MLFAIDASATNAYHFSIIAPGAAAGNHPEPKLGTSGFGRRHPLDSHQ